MMAGFDKIRLYLKVARADYWFKNIFILIGLAAAAGVDKRAIGVPLIIKVILAVFLGCLISSANYIINEIADAPLDRRHPEKKFRPVASGIVSVRALVFLDAVLVISVLAASALFFNKNFFWLMASFFIIGGAAYNLRPLRLKDIPYIDILAESVNNMLRFSLGWHIIDGIAPVPIAAVVCSWSIGAIFATSKRVAELNFFGRRYSEYRPTFAYYSNLSLLSQYFLYLAIMAVTFVQFFLRYKEKVIFSLPLVLAIFFWLIFLAFRKDSLVKEPEKLIRYKPFSAYSIFVLILFLAALLYG